ncbi:MAG: protein-L-isoaspartate(D-aspartate) O-methyltransferase [Ignavibacteriaceae bacterium]
MTDKRYISARENLIRLLRSKGITDEKVLEAMKKVERHKFVPEAIRTHAYEDIALPIGYNQTISQPYTVALMTQALQVKKGQKILEVGTGSGYQAAILEQMGAQVFTVERNLDIYLNTQKLVDKLGLRFHMKYGDGTIGWEEYAPFDRIIVTAGSPSVPPSLKKQLVEEGRLVIPVGNRLSQSLHVITKLSEDEFKTEIVPEFAFVPLIGREGWKEQ